MTKTATVSMFSLTLPLKTRGSKESWLPLKMLIKVLCVLMYSYLTGVICLFMGTCRRLTITLTNKHHVSRYYDKYTRTFDSLFYLPHIRLRTAR